jgi:hypothetical protein
MPSSGRPGSGPCALVRVLGGGAAAGVETAIADAERDSSLLPAADAALDRLPTITLRRVLSVFAATLPKRTARAPTA